MKKIAAILGMALTLAFMNGAAAHVEHDDVPPVRANPVKLEVQKSANGATVLATLDGAAYPTEGAIGMLTLTKGKREQVLQLQPSGANTMTTPKKVKIATGSKAKAVVSFADKTSSNVEVLIK